MLKLLGTAGIQLPSKACNTLYSVNELKYMHYRFATPVATAALSFKDFQIVQTLLNEHNEFCAVSFSCPGCVHSIKFGQFEFP